MSYNDSRGRYVHEDALTLRESSALTTTGTSTAVLLGKRRNVSLLLDITVDNFTTLDVVVQTSNDATNWRTLATFAQQSGVAAVRLSAGGADKYVRLSSTLVGTSATFSVTGVAV